MIRKVFPTFFFFNLLKSLFTFIKEHLKVFEEIIRKELEGEENKTIKRTIGAVLRTVKQLIREIDLMQKTNKQLAKRLKSKDNSFDFFSIDGIIWKSIASWIN